MQNSNPGGRNFLVTQISDPEGRNFLADRKFRSECHCLASRNFAELYKTVIPRYGIFCPHRTFMFDSFLAYLSISNVLF